MLWELVSQLQGAGELGAALCVLPCPIQAAYPGVSHLMGLVLSKSL